MSEKPQTLIAILVLLLALALPVVLGVLTHDIWVGLVVFASMCMLAWASASMGQDQYGVYFITLLVGVVLLAWATWQGRMEGRWVWTFPWFMFSLIGATGGYMAYAKGWPWVGVVALLLASQLGLFGVTAPTLWFDLLRLRTPESFAIRWEWALAYAGIALIAFGWLRGRDLRSSKGKTGYVIFSLVGVLLILAGMWRMDFPSSWSWLPFWLAAALMIIHAGRDVRTMSGGAAAFGMLLAAGCLAMIFVQPLWLGGIEDNRQQAAATANTAIAEETLNAQAAVLQETVIQTPSTAQVEHNQPSGAGWNGLASFVRTVVSSIWGWVYLVLLFLLGLLWVKRWGGVIAILVAAGMVWWLGLNQPVMLARLSELVSLSPWKLLEEALFPLDAVDKLVGWRIIFLALAVNLPLVIGHRLMVQANAARINLPAVRQLLGTTFAVYNLQKRGLQNSRVLLAVFFTLLAIPIIPIFLWIALRAGYSVPTGDALQFFIVPNLALPHWKPLLSLPLMAPGVLAAFVLFLQILLQNRWLNSKGLPPNQVPGMTLLLGLLFTLFVPSGVQLYVLALGLVRLVTLPLVMSGTPSAVQDLVDLEEDFSEPEYENLAEDEKQGEEKQESETPAPTASFEFKITSDPPDVRPLETQYIDSDEKTSDNEYMLQINTPFAGAVEGSRGEFWVLDRNGRLICLSDESSSWKQTPLKNPAGLLALPDGQGMAVGGEGLLITYNPGGPPQESCRIQTTYPIDGFALNPFGTIMTYLSRTQNEVRGVFLAAQRDQKLTSQEGLGSWMEFSPDGRHMGLELQDGSVLIFDMSTRQSAATFKPSFYAGAITSLCAPRAGSWLVGYAEKLVLWNIDGSQQSSQLFKSPPCCMSVDARRGWVAVGDSSGCVHLYTPDLTPIRDYPYACSGPVTRILLRSSGEGLIIVERDQNFKILNID